MNCMRNLINVSSLTIDGWSSRRLLSMLGVIVNLMSTNAKLNAELLGIKIFKGSHTGRNIEFIIAIANEWGILNKIIRIGSDNAANMAKALRIFLKDYVDHHDDLSVDEIVNEYEQFTGIIIDEDFENFIKICTLTLIHRGTHTHKCCVKTLLTLSIHTN